MIYFNINHADGSIVMINESKICYIVVNKIRSYVKTISGEEIELTTDAAIQIIEKIKNEKE